MGKKLIALALSVPLLFGGCSEKSNYNFSNGDKLEILDYVSSNILDIYTIIKNDGRVIRFMYEDIGDIKKIMKLEIKNDGVTKKYDEPEVLEEADRQIDKYLKLIGKDRKTTKKQKIEEGLRLLK